MSAIRPTTYQVQVKIFEAAFKLSIASCSFQNFSLAQSTIIATSYELV